MPKAGKVRRLGIHYVNEFLDLLLTVYVNSLFPCVELDIQGTLFPLSQSAFAIEIVS